MQAELVCQTCQHAFSTKDCSRAHVPRTPLLLSCGHTFCEACLSKSTLQNKTSICCQSCDSETTLNGEGSLRQLWPNLYCLGLLTCKRRVTNLNLDSFIRQNSYTASNSSPTNESEVICEECNRMPASCSCEKCEMDMCHQCFLQVHGGNVSKAMRKHQPSPLSSLARYEKTALTCQEHPNRSLDYYCEDDQCEICSDCVVIGSHLGHCVSNLHAKEDQARAELPDAISEVSLVLKHLHHSDTVIAKSLPRLQAKCLQLATSIKQHFQLLHGKLQAREERLIDELRNLAIEGSEPAIRLRSGIREQTDQIEKLLKVGEDALKGKGSVKGQVVLTKLKSLTSTPCVVETPSDGAQFASCSFSDQLMPLIKEYGQLINRSTDSLCLKSLSDVPEELRQLPLDELTSTSSDVSLPEADVAVGQDIETASVTSDSSSISTSTNSSWKHLSKKQLRMFKIKPGTSTLVYVTHVKNPHSFYTVSVSGIHSHENMGIENYVKQQGSLPPESRDAPTRLKVGDLVLAEYDENKAWYRARITNLLPEGDVELIYIDFGNPDTTHINKLLNMPSSMKRIPEYAVHCTLVDIRPSGETGLWSNEAARTFGKIHEEKAMTMKVLGDPEDGRLPVDLSKPAMAEIADDRPVSVRDTLIFLELACFDSPMSRLLPNGSTPRPARQFNIPDIPSAGQSIQACISHCNSPSDFYIQIIGRQSSQLQSLMIDIQTVYANDNKDLYTVFCPTKDLVCAAQYSGDESWYRAQVVKLPGRRCVEVQYVDFGNSEMLPHWKLKKIRDTFMVLPKQALRCELADVSPANEEGWCVESLKHITSMGESGHPITVTLQRVTSDGKLSVIVALPKADHMSEGCLNSLLVSEGLAVSTGASSAPHKPTSNTMAPDIAQPMSSVDTDAPENAMSVIITHIENPGRFYVRFSQEDFDSLTEELRTVYEDRAVEEDYPWQEGGECALQDTSKSWFRGLIKSIEDKHAKVFLVDLGRTDTVPTNLLYPLDEEFKKSALALCCRLADVQPAGDITRWSFTATETMNECVTGETCYIVQRGEEEDGCLPVELLLAREIKGDALTPDTIQYSSVSSHLKDKGVALASRVRTPRPVKHEPDTAKENPSSHESQMKPEEPWTGFPPPELPSSERINVVPTYVSITGIIYAQEIKEDTEKGGRLSYLLNEYSLEVITQDAYLAEKDLHRSPVPRDGNCLFRALAAGISGSQDDHMMVRRAVVESLQKEQSVCEKYGITEDYLERMNCDGTYGGETEIMTAADVYGICIDVYTGGLNSPVIHRIYGDQAVNSTHVGIIYLSDRRYDSGHYDLVVKSLSQAYQGQQVYDNWRRTVADDLLSTSTLDPLSYDTSLLAQVMTELDNHYKDTPEEDHTWQVGQHVVARYTEDKCFYRAIITKETPSGYEVQYIDFGNTEVVTADKLRQVTILKDIPQQCYECELFGVKPVSADGSWSVKLIEFIHQLTVGQSCTLYLKVAAEEGQRLQVEVVLPDNRDLADVLIHDRLAEAIGNKLPPAPQTPSTPPMSPPTLFTPMSALLSPPGEGQLVEESVLKPMLMPEPGGILAATITHVMQPNMVYIQRVRVEGADSPEHLERNTELDRLAEMTTSLCSIAEALPVLQQPQPGRNCLAQFTADNQWYRAFICLIEDDFATVFFYDYGNADKSAVDNLRELPEEFTDLPQQACLCQLTDLPLPSPHQQWSDDSCHCVFHHLGNRPLTACVKKPSDDERPACVSLYETEEFKTHGLDAPLAYQSLIDAGVLLENQSSSLETEDQLSENVLS